MSTSTISPSPPVFIVNDDTEMRDSLCYLMRTVGLKTSSHESGSRFLEVYADQPGCLLTDVRMPDISGLELREALLARGFGIPVIFMTAFADVPMAIRAMKLGAAEFIEKPFHAQSLLDRVQAAIAEDHKRRQADARWQELADRMSLVTSRETEALDSQPSGRSERLAEVSLSRESSTEMPLGSARSDGPPPRIAKD
ncbi:MAG: response regulator transcription factor [Planctomycetaceae bacterium]|nr:response regulator transcription factor [Planctomycetaceae bacterium]